MNEKVGRVSFKSAWRDYWHGYVEFLGQTTRAGYWWLQLVLGSVWVVLVGWLITAVLSVLSQQAIWQVIVLPVGVMLIVGLATLLPTLALKVRRLRDAGLRGRGVAVVLGLQYLLSTSVKVNQGNQAAHQLMVWPDVHTTLTFTRFHGVDALSRGLVMALGLLILVLTVLPTDTLLTTSGNRVVRFFLRVKE